MIAFDVMPLIAGALLEERTYWRETLACEIQALTSELSGRFKPRPYRSPAAIRHRLGMAAVSLADALAGNLHSRCEACGHPVRPGDATIYGEDTGDMHARCFVGRECAVGEQVKVDPDCISWDEEDEAMNPGGRPDHVTVGACSALFTQAKIAEIAATAVALTAPGGNA